MQASLYSNEFLSKELGVEDFSPKINKGILGNKTHRTLLEPSLMQKTIHFDRSILNKGMKSEKKKTGSQASFHEESS